jgi:hypothetical protein
MAVTDGRIPWLVDHDKRFSVTMSHAAHFINEAIEILLFNDVFDRLKDFKCSGRPTAGSRSDPDDWGPVIP